MVDAGDAPRSGPLPWSQAWSAATSFWTDGPGLGGPSAHFRTSAHSGSLLAEALLRLLHEVDLRLGRPERLDVVDVGAGGGELLAGLLRGAEPALSTRLRMVGVDLLPRPAGLDVRIGWVQGPAPGELPEVRGLLVAHEWLDELPVEVVQLDESRALRTVLVDGGGRESIGGPVDDDVRAWVERWWPSAQPGDRAECGAARDQAWASLVARVSAGTALAVDYGHVRAERDGGRYAAVHLM